MDDILFFALARGAGAAAATALNFRFHLHHALGSQCALRDQPLHPLVADVALQAHNIRRFHRQIWLLFRVMYICFAP